MRIAIAAILLAACGGAPRAQPEHHLGVAGHRAAAADHEARAATHEAEAHEHLASPGPYVCGDSVLSDQVTSGGERIMVAIPCWNTDLDAGRSHHELAERERVEAARHRLVASHLVNVERTRCSAMPAGELDHTPFWHRADIAAVERLVERGTVRGARIRFRRVPSLTTAWLIQAMDCHRARAAAIGWEARYMSYDPTLLPGATATVRETPAGMVVEVRSRDADVAAVIVGRAEALLVPATDS
jgi:hypothetical protein